MDAKTVNLRFISSEAGSDTLCRYRRAGRRVPSLGRSLGAAHPLLVAIVNPRSGVGGVTLSPALCAGAAASVASAQQGSALFPPPVLAGASLGVMGGSGERRRREESAGSSPGAPATLPTTLRGAAGGRPQG